MEIIFYDNVNLYKLYNDTIEKLQEIERNKDNILEEYEILSCIIENSHNNIDISDAKEKQQNNKFIIDMLKKDNLIKSFKKETIPLIKLYVEISGYSNIYGIDKCKCIPKRVYIIICILEIINRYVKIKWTCTYDLSKYCTICFSVLNKCDQVMYCNKCDKSYSIHSLPSITSKVKVKKKSTYNATKNFKKEYLRVCSNIMPVDEVEINNIDYYLYYIGIFDPTHMDIRNAIEECGYNNYNDTNQIHAIITGKPMPDLYRYLDVCIERFVKYWEIFESIDTDGNNITNIHFLIKLFLWQEKIQYDEAWFRILKEDTEQRHKNNAIKICEILGKKEGKDKWPIPEKWLK